MNIALFPDVIVNGETIPSAAIAAEAQNHTAPKDKPGIAWRKAAQALAIRALLLARGAGARAGGRPRGTVPRPGRDRRRSPDPRPAGRGADDCACDGRSRSAPNGRATLAAIARPRLWDVSHILCACDPRDDAESAMAEARARPSWRGWTATPRALPRRPRKRLRIKGSRAGIWASLAPAIPCPSSRRRCAPCPKAA